jgi:hypothetical protein
MGKAICMRTFTKVLDGAYIQLTADWEYEKGFYEEIALIGVGPMGMAPDGARRVLAQHADRSPPFSQSQIALGILVKT